MAHYDILAFLNDLFWIFLFFSFFFLTIDELFLKKYCELTFLKHYIYLENAWVKVFVFNRFFFSYFSFLSKCYSKSINSSWVSLYDMFTFIPFSSELFEEVVFEKCSKEKILKNFKRKKEGSFVYFNFFTFFLSVW